MSQPSPPPGTIRARFRCRAVNRKPAKDEVVLQAVSANRDDPEVNRFAEATPYGELRIGIENPDIRGKFTPGEEYYIDIGPVD